MVVLILRDSVGFWERHWGCRGPRNHLAKKMVINEGCRCLRRDSHKCLHIYSYISDNARRRKYCTPTPEQRSPRFSRPPSRHSFPPAAKGEKRRPQTQIQVTVANSQIHTVAAFYAFQSAMWASDSPLQKVRQRKNISTEIYVQRTYMYNIKSYEWKASGKRGRSAGPAFCGLKAPKPPLLTESQ